MIKFSFVILHYITIDDTIRCVESIEKLDFDGAQYIIVIVNNGSPDVDLKKLRSKYSNNKRVVILNSKKNLGFARGNNLGFEYAKKHFSPDFIVLCNNDTQILTKNFPNEVLAAYRTYQFAVMGPKEILSDGSLYSYTDIPRTDQVRKKVGSLKADLRCPLRPFFRAKLASIKRVIKKAIKYNSAMPYDLSVEKMNVVLHGAFLIFSRRYISEFDGLDDRTFMYGEEDLLMQRLIKHNMTSYYNPRIEILHLHGSSTKIANGVGLKAIRTRTKRELDSAKILLHEMEK